MPSVRAAIVDPEIHAPARVDHRDGRASGLAAEPIPGLVREIHRIRRTAIRDGAGGIHDREDEPQDPDPRNDSESPAHPKEPHSAHGPPPLADTSQENDANDHNN